MPHPRDKIIQSREDRASLGSRNCGCSGYFGRKGMWIRDVGQCHTLNLYVTLLLERMRCSSCTSMTSRIIGWGLRDCPGKGCGIDLGILFFFSDFFFFWLGVVLGLSRLLFGKTQGWKAGSCGFFRTFGGGFRAVQAPFWGNQWWNAGSIQVWTQKTASKSKLSGSFLFSVCIYLCWCVCVFVIEYVVCVFFLLLFWFFIQCTSFLVFAIYLFNV